MSEFRSINTSIVNSEKFRTLHPAEKLMFFQLLCHPAMNSVGCIRMTFNELADYTGYSASDVESVCDSLSKSGIVDVDKDMAVISIRGYIEHNRPRNPNIVKSWIKIFKELPLCFPKEMSIMEAIIFVERDATENFKRRVPDGLANELAEQMESRHAVFEMAEALEKEQQNELSKHS